MKTPFLSGEGIYLRPLTLEDAEGPYCQWLNDSELTRYMESGYFPQTVDSLKEYVQRTYNSDKLLMLAIIEKSSGTHLGNIKLEPISWIHRTAWLGLLIGDKEAWGKGYGTEAARLVIGYAFQRLNLRKISLAAVAGNQPALRLYEKVGFHVEGIMKEEFYNEGRYEDIVYMGLFNPRERTSGEGGHPDVVQG